MSTVSWSLRVVQCSVFSVQSRVLLVSCWVCMCHESDHKKLLAKPGGHITAVASPPLSVKKKNLTEKQPSTAAALKLLVRRPMPMPDGCGEGKQCAERDVGSELL